MKTRRKQELRPSCGAELDREEEVLSEQIAVHLPLDGEVESVPTQRHTAAMQVAAAECADSSLAGQRVGDGRGGPEVVGDDDDHHQH